MAIYSGFSHKKWWFSIVMLVYQRVTMFDVTWSTSIVYITSFMPIVQIPVPKTLEIETILMFGRPSSCFHHVFGCFGTQGTIQNSLDFGSKLRTPQLGDLVHCVGMVPGVPFRLTCLTYAISCINLHIRARTHTHIYVSLYIYMCVCMYTHAHMNQSTFATLASNLNYRELAVRTTCRDATILPINNTFFFVVINFFGKWKI